jgi:Domain of unknown function (DUF6894)
MRYYFHAVSLDVTIPDTQGIELTDDEAEHIGSIIEEMRMEEPELFDVTGLWSIEIVNEKGDSVVRFSVASTSLSEATRAALAARHRALKWRH